MMKKIEKLPNEPDEVKESRRIEGYKRERYSTMFGSLKGYNTKWKDVNGWNYLFNEGI